MMYVLHYSPDLSSLIVRLVLEEMGLPYRAVEVDFEGGGHRSASYRRMNPAGLIPALETPQGPLFETAAILLWLSETHGGMAPPPGAGDRGAFLKWLFFTSNTLHADLRALAYSERYSGAMTPGTETEAIFVRGTERRLLGHLQLLDALAAENRDWFRADTPSLLTYYTCCILRWMRYFPGQDAQWFRLAHFPRLDHIATGMESRPAAIRAAEAEGLGPTLFTAPQFG